MKRFKITQEKPNGTGLHEGETVILHETLTLKRAEALTDIAAEDIAAMKPRGRLFLVYREAAKPTLFTDENIMEGIGKDYFCIIDEANCKPCD